MKSTETQGGSELLAELRKQPKDSLWQECSYCGVTFHLTESLGSEDHLEHRCMKDGKAVYRNNY